MPPQNPYTKRGSFQWFVADLALSRGMDQDQVVAHCLPIVAQQQDDRFIFRAHGPNGLAPLPIAKQVARMEKFVAKVFRQIEAAQRPEPPQGGAIPSSQGGGATDGVENNEGTTAEGETEDGAQGDGDDDNGAESDGDADGSQGEDGDGAEDKSSDDRKSGAEQGDDDAADGENNADAGTGDDDAADGAEQLPMPLPAPPTPPPSQGSDWSWFVAEVERIHAWCADRAESGEWVDDFGMRPLIDGARAFRAGIAAPELLHAMTLHWSEETRRDAGIGSVTPGAGLPVPDGRHPLLAYVARLAEARIPIMLVGPKGAGKSHLARDLADLLGLAYGECPMTAGASPSWLIGGETMSGYRSRPFVELYANGGVFSFEEVDAADPNMTIVLNNALASDRFYNPANGEVLHRHPDFVAVATANTFGLGANRDYTGRERLDGAFLDRFRMGRVTVGIDWTLGKNIAASILDAPEPAEQTPEPASDNSASAADFVAGLSPEQLAALAALAGVAR